MTKEILDKLNMQHINSLPQPFIVHFVGGYEWPVHDIDVGTGLLRINVCGKLQVKHIGEAIFFRDMDGVEHDTETFYSDYKIKEKEICSDCPNRSKCVELIRSELCPQGLLNVPSETAAHIKAAWRGNIMLPKFGEKIKIVDLPSYKKDSIPDLPVIAEVIRVDPYPYIVVTINGKQFELYEDDGYELINT